MKIESLETPAISTSALTEMPADSSSSSTTELPFYRLLGRTGLKVSCLGIGGGGDLASDDVLYAFATVLIIFLALHSCK